MYKKINIHKLIKKKIRKGIDIRKINQEEIKKDRQIVGELSTFRLKIK